MNVDCNYAELYRNGFTVSTGNLPETFRLRLRVDCIERITGQYLEDGVAATAAVDPLEPLHCALIHYGAAILQSETNDARYLAGAIIPKYPEEPMRPWHVDWWAWQDIATKRVQPPAVGVLFYLDAATEISGALMVVPGSHMASINNHECYVNTTDALCLSVPDVHRTNHRQLDVPAGGIIILDSRTMHAVSPSRDPAGIRICVTLWYMLGWASLSDRVKATVRLSTDPAFKLALGSLYPEYTGSAEPYEHRKIPIYD